MVSNTEKWRISLLAGLVFLLLSLPMTYDLIQSVGNLVNLNLANSGCPTTLGLAVSTILYVLVSRALMG